MSPKRNTSNKNNTTQRFLQGTVPKVLQEALSDAPYIRCAVINSLIFLALSCFPLPSLFIVMSANIHTNISAIFLENLAAAILSHITSGSKETIEHSSLLCYYCGRLLAVSCILLLSVFAGFSIPSIWRWYHTLSTLMPL
ncbi:hypothetical protein PILCRDRAFT_638513 [Piloderma croceum F 1598]|uniref:Uncharacterized protein n=1 Tax=Piloderma croceum (strain F 1598) TaxID=765440 RepID=A0A0C3EWD9_PILCF|nr:hypothetical protein PILCRDRAFT_638513 [Piloderma croceum F 1598]